MPLSEVLDRLASFEPTNLPVISLYLNTQPDQHGRANFGPFVRKEFRARSRTYPLRSPERQSFERDSEKIERYLSEELRPSANGLAIFACAGANDFFEAVQLDAPIDEHRLYVCHLLTIAFECSPCSFIAGQLCTSGNADASQDRVFFPYLWRSSR